jgi:CHAT domain-containing protein
VEDLGSPDAFAEAASSCDLLHIASHALVMDRAPWWSGIQLRSLKPGTARRSEVAEPAPHAEQDYTSLSEVDSLLVERTFPSDPYVRAWQIAQLDIPARLAVLSACETAGGRMTTGEGTLGLTAAFLSAGVPVVVSSLWPVDDRVTAILMRAFYGDLAAGEPVATALRRAQLEVSRSGKYGHPYFWSGFTVVGDGVLAVPIEKRSPASNRVLLAGVGGLVLLILAWTAQRRQARASVQ